MSATALLGVSFLLLGFVTAYLMFHFWGYPYDDVNKRSSCPQWKMNIHRGFGYAYILVYVALMTEMLPRLWTYQVEFPARTVAHICAGLAIGGILIVKVSIIRWFRHLEELMPALGISLLLLTIIVTGLSLPFAFKERHLSGERAFSATTRERLLRVLPAAGIAKDEPEAARLASEPSLRDGRRRLLSKCTHCHDLRTVILRPRMPEDWVRTVERMAGKPALGQKITAEDRTLIASYLIAITPELQASVKSLREEKRSAAASRDALDGAVGKASGMGPGMGSGAAAPVDTALAKETFERTCSQCHSLDQVAGAPPRSEAEITGLLERMIGNGLRAEEEDLTLIRAYLHATYVEGR